MSLNANGLQSAAKRKAIYKLIRRGAFDVAFLQETHCVENLERIWRAEWGGETHFSNGRTNARGVATLIRRDSAIKVLEMIKDDEGRLLILLNQEKFVLANVYAPTQDRPGEQAMLLDFLEEKISDLNSENIIKGGDLNLCFDHTLDKSSRSRPSGSPDCGQYRDRVKALCENLFLTDVWRHLNPTTKAFSFRRGQYASRLDYWLASEHMMSADSSSKIETCALSDHSIITLKLGVRS